MSSLRGSLAALLIAIAGLLPTLPAVAADSRVRFELDLAAGRSSTAARIIVRHNSTSGQGALRGIVLDNTRLKDVSGDGQLAVDQDALRWTPPDGGGSLRYRVALQHRRPGKTAVGNDAWVGERFALFRGEDAFPVRSWRRTKGSTLEGELAIKLPSAWSLVTPYRPDAAGRLAIHNPGQRLPRPIGWLIAGDLGTRRDTIAGIEVTVTAPRGLRMERIAMLGLLRWTLPELAPRLATPAAARSLRQVSIASAAEPMWLGALSAPNSIFVHADRPLISENGTSTIVHEMVHVLLADLETPSDQDWIDEGLAEYLALRALKDSGTISVPRYEATLAGFRQWGKDAKSLRTRAAAGAVTARAVSIFHELDAELRAATGGRATVASLVQGLLQRNQEATLDSLRTAARTATGKGSRVLARGAVPGLD